MENVNHPKHYNQGKFEVIDEMRLLFGTEAVITFCKLNAYKYFRRAEFKENKEQDIAKGEWYLEYIDRIKHSEKYFQINGTSLKRVRP